MPTATHRYTSVDFVPTLARNHATAAMSPAITPNARPSSGRDVTSGDSGAATASVGASIRSVDGEPGAERGDVGACRLDLTGVVTLAQHERDQLGDRAHLRFGHPLGGDRRRADAQAAGDERAARVVWHGVLVQRDARLIEHDLGLLAGELGVEGAQVDDHHVVVGAAADEPEALTHERLGQRRGVAY